MPNYFDIYMYIHKVHTVVCGGTRCGNSHTTQTRTCTVPAGAAMSAAKLGGGALAEALSGCGALAEALPGSGSTRDAPQPISVRHDAIMNSQISCLIDVADEVASRGNKKARQDLKKALRSKTQNTRSLRRACTGV